MFESGIQVFSPAPLSVLEEALIVLSQFQSPSQLCPKLCFLFRVCPSLSGGMPSSSISSPSHIGSLQVCLIGEWGKRDRERPVLVPKPPERPPHLQLFLPKKEYQSCCMCMENYILHLNVAVIFWRKGDRIPSVFWQHLIFLLWLLYPPLPYPWFCPILHFPFLFCIELFFSHWKNDIAQEPKINEN